MKKVVKLFIGLSVLTMLMVCMTAVSFAGTAEDRVCVDITAGSPGAYDYIGSHIEVKGDMFEKAYPELAEYDLQSGVSFADAIVAAHEDFYGQDAKNFMSFEGSAYGLSVAKQFGHDKNYVGLYAQNKHLIELGIGSTEINDIDDLFILSFKDAATYADLFGCLEEYTTEAEPNKDFSLSLKARNFVYDENYNPTEVDVIPYEASLKLVNPETLDITDLDGFTYNKEDGTFTGKFANKGVYYVTATGKVKYDGYFGETDAEIACPMTLVIVGDYATVTFTAAAPGHIDYMEDLWGLYEFPLDKELKVNSSLAEGFFPELAAYEAKCEGVSFADALVAAHIEKYGLFYVKDYLNIADYTTWAATTKMFGREGDGFFYTNDVINPSGVCEFQVKDGDRLFAGSYVNGWNDLYSFFDKTSVSTTAGKEVSLDLTLDGYGTQYPAETVEVKTVDTLTGDLKDLPGASYKDGKVAFKFSKAGTYYVTVDGTVTYDSGYGEAKGSFAGAICKVTVKDAKPAKPVIKSAKRNTKTKATVTWKKAANAKKYEVAYKVKGAKKWTTKKTASTKIVLKKLKAKKAYQVKVRSINGSAKSAYSKVKTIKKK